ncbi:MULTISPECIES: hypothetical protein [unclassified Pseudomonas]|uniref:hypothetical protein n=1 Tax=unclassified Pseudomonas TaxID=196821 RepID=UPI00072FE2EA|nr:MULTISPECIES: hypothetical protein [unclassified Pseudomonas]KSW25057.1 hypothetical protein AOX63_15265 [Pseudomonas sp. ADP]OBP09333.1 hypothetical protein BAE52_19495 [Pseudomonas sp. EGD-AKN5]QOF87634.1 hypothetical protein IG194_13440 [Pseudomonas sp. ADPe]
MTGKDVLQVLADGAHIHPEQFGHQLLRQPQDFVLIAGLDALFAGLASEDQELGRAVADQFFAIHTKHFHVVCTSTKHALTPVR